MLTRPSRAFRRTPLPRAPPLAHSPHASRRSPFAFPLSPPLPCFRSPLAITDQFILLPKAWHSMTPDGVFWLICGKVRIFTSVCQTGPLP